MCAGITSLGGKANAMSNPEIVLQVGKDSGVQATVVKVSIWKCH
jgi:hypothetical protein